MINQHLNFDKTLDEIQFNKFGQTNIVPISSQYFSKYFNIGINLENHKTITPLFTDILNE